MYSHNFPVSSDNLPDHVRLYSAYRVYVESLKAYQNTRENYACMATLRAWKATNRDKVSHGSSGVSFLEQPNGKAFATFDYRATPPSHRDPTPLPEENPEDIVKKGRAAPSGSNLNETVEQERVSYWQEAFKQARISEIR